MNRRDAMRRLIDGRPDDSGRAIARRERLLVVPVVSTANIAGAFVVFSLITWVVPTPDLDDRHATVLANTIAFAIFGPLALIVGVAWGTSRFIPIRSWLASEAPPTHEQRATVLRAPLSQLIVTGTLWTLGVVVFTILNATYSGALAVVVAITVALGGLTTCSITYLLTERIMRSAVARALVSGAPDRPVVPGVVTRALLAWAVGTALPVFGLALVALTSLAGRTVGEHQLAVTSLVLGGVALGAGLLVTWQAARATADPVISVREALARVQRGELDAEVPVFDGSELGLLQAGFNRMVGGLREREQMRDLFGRHVGTDVARAALDRGTDLGGEVRDAAVLFCDIVGSTRIAAQRAPHETVGLLNGFFAVVVEVVEEHGGYVSKFEGDAALAIFGVPIERADASDSALTAARSLARRLREEVTELDAGIGVSAGQVLAGNIGAEQRFEYTVIGDPVNEASRLTDLAKHEDGRLLASETIVLRAGETEASRWEVGEQIELRGRPRPTRLARPRS